MTDSTLTRRRHALTGACRMLALAASVGTLSGLAGCGFGDSPGSAPTSTSTPPPAPAPTPAPPGGPTVGGTVVKGPVAGATVTAYAMNTDGSLGASLGSGPTAADGTFSFALTGTPTAAVALVAAGGTYTSEADGASVTKGSDFAVVLASVGSGGVTGLALSPVSDMVAARARALMAGGSAVADALSAAYALLAGTYSLPADALPTLLPTFTKASIGTPAFTLGVILGSLDTCDKALPTALRGHLFSALSADFSDGLFDGKAAGVSISVGSGTALSSTAGTSDFLSCVAGYAASGKAVLDAGITSTDIAAVTTAVRTAVVGSAATPTSTGLSAGSSGAISSLAYGGKQWLFLAARQNGVVAVDITDPLATAPQVKVFSALVANNFHNLPIGGVVPLLGASHPQLLVYAYGSKHLALVNADTGDVDFETDLPLAATSPVGFSGGSAYIAGAIPDTGRDGVWLATADGYLFFNRATQSVGTTFTIASPAELAENVGGDVVHDMLFAANYEPGVQIADIASGKSYYLGDTAFSTVFPQMFEPDGGAVDTNLQVGIVTDEDSDEVGFINLKTIVRTDSTTGRNTFLPATGGSVGMSLGTPILSGSAVDSDSHLVLFMAGYSTDVAVGLLQDPASVPTGGTWQGLSDWRYVKNLTGYSIARDPHAVAVVKNLANGKSYGYLLDGSGTKSFQIDMAAMLGAAAVGGSSSTAHMLAVDPVATGIVKSIAW